MKNSSSSAQVARDTAPSRVIPRERLQGFAAWRPGSFDSKPAGPSPEDDAGVAPAPTEQEWLQRLQVAQKEAHQEGYHNGYRDGLVALENFKQALALQATQQMDLLLKRLEDEIDALQPQLARAVCDIATALAEQVLRQALREQPEAVAVVAGEAVQAVAQGARRITVHLHPDDLDWVRTGAPEALEARQARLMADPALDRGDCIVRSETGSVDARVASRWAQAIAAMGNTRAAGPDDQADEPR